MSGYLWKYFLENDVDRFRQLLETAGYNTRTGGHRTSGHTYGASIGSPESFGTSPTLVARPRKLPTASNIVLTRADINYKDNLGLTVLHHAVSSTSEYAIGFASALLDHPLTDIYIQDTENGWTALHRAFYFGNINLARLILERDRRDMLSSGSNSHAGGLIKIKDKEGNAPFDLYAMTIQDRSLRLTDELGWRSDDEEVEDSEAPDIGDDGEPLSRKDVVRPQVVLGGDVVFTFGSNKNVTLGFGDEDDRQYPERVILRRPDHLLYRFHREHVERRNNTTAATYSSGGDWSHHAPPPVMPVSDLPTIIRTTPLIIQDVAMSKLSSAFLTTDPESNLYMCGHGPGGRLGTGNESTRYQPICVEGGALSGKKIVAIALGQNHTLAVSGEGEIFSWGSNGFGQLGYALPKTSVKDEEPMQTIPRQIYGPLKREIMMGVAASRTHSVAHTSTALYTFGKNDGQLGIIDSDARSLDTQTTPRRIAAALFSSSIHSVSAIERATVVLLDNHDVWVFANYGYSKVLFPLDGFANYFLKTSFLTTKYEKTPNRISKICSGGDAICALSTSGEIFTVSVSKRADAEKDTTSSTTNPNKIRGALSVPQCVWSAKKGHMAARDVDVDQDGSIILTTDAGSVWRRVKRAKIKDATASGISEYKPKDYKFSRIPGLTRVTGVRASSYGAYAAIRNDSNVTREQIPVSEPGLWIDVAPLLVFGGMAACESSVDLTSNPELWRRYSAEAFQRRVMMSDDLEKDVADIIRGVAMQGAGTYDAEILTTTSDVRIPVHQFVLAGRSSFLRGAFAEAHESGEYAVADVLSIKIVNDGKLAICFRGVDFLTIFCLVQYSYTDTIVSFWHFARQFPKLAHRYREIRIEVMKLASRLEMRQLETAARQMVSPKRTMNRDFELATQDPSFFSNGDILVQLEDDEIQLHSALMCQRCPFFEGLFMGRAGGLWLAGRREAADSISNTLTVDLTHINSAIFNLVMRHIYADAGEEIFDDAVSDDLNDHFALDELLDLITEVMGVANELMLNRLSQICQNVIGRYGEVSVRNVCGLLNAIAPCSVTDFKDAALEYICLNLESLLQNGSLDELEEDLLFELDQVVRDNQLACLPIARSGRAEAMLFETYPELAERLDRSRRAKIDSILLSNKFATAEGKVSTSFRAQSLEEIAGSTLQNKMRRRSRTCKQEEPDNPELASGLKTKKSAELLFDMSEEEGESDDGVDSPDGHLPSQLDSTPVVDVEPLTAKLLEVQQATTPTRLPASESPARPVDRPWGIAPLSTSKLDLKDIMAQTSSTRQSGLSLALSANSSKEPRSGGSFVTKLSQKERKRLQQQSQQPQSPQPLAESGNASPRPAASAWLTSKAGGHPFGNQSNNTSSSPHSQQASRTPSTPQLTMRQTVANKAPSKQNAARSSDVVPPTLQRHASGMHTAASPTTPSIDTPSRPSPQRAPGASGVSTSITPRSVRHLPITQADSTVSPDQKMSLLSILSQQQLEKDIIRDAITGPKRSLQEIQQEQEFQQWWDQESRRVMDEEKKRKKEENMARKRDMGGHGRGRGGRKLKGKGDGDKASQEKSAANVSAPADQKIRPGGEVKNKPQRNKPPSGPRAEQSSSSRGNSVGRGGRASHHGGRGRGKERAADGEVTRLAHPTPT